ncbi:hypothetical protein TI39_contig616g00001 [Zymoseptoria brevis]|uniref:Uncharacterized protein n=1 Tax=Zymoseptoria brevis TaxID=1047168 RepID=A0A0F4GHN9_9PEZI|nr:hypothetical protein TI39_contig616g00001 [Zymoseptoria brevis]
MLASLRIYLSPGLQEKLQRFGTSSFKSASASARFHTCKPNTHHTLPILFFASLLPLISADFLIANATACTGPFPINTCTHGVKVLSGTNDATEYTCDHLIRAQDSNYLSGGTAGPHGMNVVAKQGICDSGRLEFVKDGYISSNDSPITRTTMSNANHPHIPSKLDFKNFKNFLLSQTAGNSSAQEANDKRTKGMSADEKKSGGDEGKEEEWTLVDSEKERIAKELEAEAELRQENAVLDDIEEKFEPTIGK